MKQDLTRRGLLVSSLALAACQRDQKLQIAVIPKATSHEFWLTVQKGALAAGKELNVDIDWNGPASETEYARQIQIMESAINKRVDGIALAPTERQALKSVVERAAAQKIPVTIFDSSIDSDDYVSFVASDNYAAGLLAGETLGNIVNAGPIAMLNNAPGSASTLDRERGFEDAIKKFPGIEIVARQFSMSDRSKARANAENFLTAYPNLKGLFGSTDPSATGAALAVKARSLSGKVAVVAFDLSPGILADLKDGVVSAMVIQDPERMGHDAVSTLIDKIRGKNPPKRVNLPAYAVTNNNLADPAIKRLLSGL